MEILKKFATLCLALVLALSLGFALTACNEKRPTNETNESSGTESDGSTETDPDESSGTESGGSTETDPDESSGTESEEQTREAYREVYGKISDLLMDTALDSMAASAGTGTEQPTAGKNSGRNAILYAALYTAENEIYTEAVTNSTWFIGATAYVYLASELYKNASFVVTDSPVGYTVTPESNGTVAHTDVIMMSNMNAETGEVLLQLEFETTEYREGVPYSDKNYIYIDADYDFTEKEVETLLIHIWSISNSNLVLSAKYSNETFRHMNDTYTQEVIETVTALRTTYESRFEEKVQLGDYTAEYERANDYMSQKIDEMFE